MKLVPIVLVALSLLVGCSAGQKKIEELEKALKSQEERLRVLRERGQKVDNLESELAELKKKGIEGHGSEELIRITQSQLQRHTPPAPGDDSEPSIFDLSHVAMLPNRG